MSRHHSSQKQGSSKAATTPTSDGLASRPFAQPETVAAERSPEPQSPEVEAAPISFASLGISAEAPPPVQPKLTIGAPGDPYEQEADQMAKQVVQRLYSPQSIQRHGDHAEDEIHRRPAEDEDELQRKPTLQLQRTDEATPAHPDLENSIQQARQGGSPLDTQVREPLEQAFGGVDFGGVKIHTDAQSDQLNRSIHALAFTTGQDIFFRSGEYQPGSRSGKELLAHELTHVVQQNGQSVQRHSQHHEDELQTKLSLQRHQDEELQKKSSGSCQAGCQCSACTGASVTAQGNTGPLLSRKLTDVVHRQVVHRQMAPGQAIQRRAGCACPTCQGGNTRVQRQSEPKHGAGCSCPNCSGNRDQIQAKFIQAPLMTLQRHAEKEEPVQRSIRRWVQTKADPAPLTRSITPTSGVIQRHSSWEHQLLGDAQPTDLAKIGTWQDLIEQTKLEGTFGFRKRKKEKAEIDIEGVGTITKGNVMHVIAQELQRLDEWQKNPPQEASSGDIDPKYQTVLVAIPGGGKDGKSPLVITYGEMNTLADYYGNLDVMKGADPKVRWEVIQSVRKETFLRLSDIYSKLKDSLTDTEKQDADYQTAQGMMDTNTIEQIYFNRNKFADANEADFISGKAGQITLLATDAGAKRENEYSATLARNACHFVPESWHAWSSYHQKGREHAQIAWDKKSKAETILSNYATQYKAYQDEIDKGNDVDQNKFLLGFLTQQKDNAEQKSIPEAKEEANEAILNNGFGDHYLQDSYAAGHMINKTMIMQWFVQWLDTEKWKMDFSSDENWRRVQAIAYKQPELASMMQYDKSQVQGYDEDQTENRAANPQAVEDIQDEDWMVRFEALGLQIPTSLRTPGTPARILLEWWQMEAAINDIKQEMPGEVLIENNGQLNFGQMKLALKNLISDGIVYLQELSAAESGRDLLSGKKAFNTDATEEGFEMWTFVLRTPYIPKNLGKFVEARNNSQQNNDDSQYQRMAAAVTYQDYMAFMNNAYVQKSTNALHDVFCKNGLLVSSGGGQPLFKVYGDDSMFNKESAKGVKHSGETANMSRDAIRNIIATGNDGGITTQSILDRLPSHVKPEGAAALSIEAWHNPSKQGILRNYCEKTVFPNMGVLDKGAGATGDLTKFISKDKAKVHGSDAF